MILLAQFGLILSANIVPKIILFHRITLSVSYFDTDHSNLFLFILKHTLPSDVGQVKPARAVPNMDKSVGGGNYKARKDAVKKCFNMAAKKGLTVFTIQDGGWCCKEVRKINGLQRRQGRTMG